MCNPVSDGPAWLDLTPADHSYPLDLDIGPHPHDPRLSCETCSLGLHRCCLPLARRPGTMDWRSFISKERNPAVRVCFSEPDIGRPRMYLRISGKQMVGCNVQD